MAKKLSTGQLVKTWTVLCMVPLYFSAAVLWMRSEIKSTLELETAKAPKVSSIKTPEKPSYKEKIKATLLEIR